jgi:hypothetical protein
MIYTLLSKAYSISFPIIGETTVKLLKNSMKLLGMFCCVVLSALYLEKYNLLMINDICGQIFTNNKVSHNFKEFTVSLTFQNSPKKAVQINIMNN